MTHVPTIVTYRNLEFKIRNCPISTPSFVHITTLRFKWFYNRIRVDTTSMVPWAKLYQSISLLTFYSSICKSALFLINSKKVDMDFYNFLGFKMWSKIWKMRQCWFNSRSAKASSLYMGSLYVLGRQETYWKEFSYHQVLDKFSPAYANPTQNRFQIFTGFKAFMLSFSDYFSVFGSLLEEDGMCLQSFTNLSEDCLKTVNQRKYKV